MKKVAFYTLGCKVNQYETEAMLEMFEKDGYEPVGSEDYADVYVINTCTVTHMSDRKSRQYVRRMRKKNPDAIIAVVGCYSQVSPEEILEIEEVNLVMGTNERRTIVNEIKKLEALEGEKKASTVDDIMKVRAFEEIEISQSNGRTRAFMKIQDGCDRFCTYCIIPKLRGKQKSRKIEDIVAEAKSLAENGVKELVVIAQDSTMYGSDIYGEARLPQLLEELAKIDGLKWIRIMYSYPESITKELVDVIRRHDNICSYFDMPIQHASNKILKLMNRQTTKEELLEKVNMIRSAIPNATLRTTLITGFPGEDEKDFEELVEFVKEVKFDKLGVFPYSREEGTAADKLTNHLEQEVKEQRRDTIMMIQQEISEEINKNKVGNTYEVLIEEQIENNVYVGRTQFDAEEIDSIVYVKSHTELEPGDFVNVKINTALEYDLMGDIQDEFAK